MSRPRVWLITGTSSGFGRCMAEYALEKGDMVIATLRTPSAISDLSDKYDSKKLLVLKLDVTKSQEIANAFEQSVEAFGRIDVVFNNAGRGYVGEIEGTSDKAAREAFELNFWGAAKVTQEALRVFREVNSPPGGRLVQNSSCFGLEASPGSGFYNAAKFALEGLSETLVKELDPAWNIRVTLLEPGPFATKTLVNGVVEPQHPAYTASHLPTSMMRQYFENIKFDGDPAKAAKAIYKLIELPEPPLRLPLGHLALASARKKAESILGDVSKYEAWSEDMVLDTSTN